MAFPYSGGLRRAVWPGVAHRVVPGVALLLALAACTPSTGGPSAGGPSTGPSSDAARADLGIELVRRGPDAGAPDGPEGACWDKDVTPAVIETTTDQVLVSPETRDATGRITSPATFRTVTAQRMVQEREEVWFRVPCPDEITVAFVASLQRALKARGLYLLPVTGTLDAATLEAIRRFQAERGLDSPTLSLAAARELGLIAVDLDRL